MAFIEANKFFGRWESDFKVSLYTYNFCYSSNYRRIMTNSNYSSCYNSSIFNLQFLFISYNCLLASAYNFAITGIKVKLVSFYSKISTSNHMFWKAIWNQLPECVFENFEISKFLKKWEGDLFFHFITLIIRYIWRLPLPVWHFLLSTNTSSTNDHFHKILWTTIIHVYTQNL